MSKRNKRGDSGGFVFSTNSDFEFESDSESFENLEPDQQKLRVYIERKGRGGKTASIVKGFEGSEEDLIALSKLLKSKCGVGGAVKDGEIIIQGDQRDKIVKHLQAEGYTNSKKAGG